MVDISVWLIYGGKSIRQEVINTELSCSTLYTLQTDSRNRLTVHTHTRYTLHSILYGQIAGIDLHYTHTLGILHIRVECEIFFGLNRTGQVTKGQI